MTRPPTCLQHTQDLTRMNVDVAGLSFNAAPGLVDHNPYQKGAGRETTARPPRTTFLDSA